MDEQPVPSSGAATERPMPPGTYRWDGRTFRPAGTGPGAILITIAVGLVAGLVGVGLGRVALPSTPSATTTTSATAAPTAVVTAAPTVAATQTPAPTPQTLSGSGSKVLTVNLAAGRYKVAWTAQGHDNFMLDVLGTRDVSLVNEIPPNPASGETVLTVQDSGSYTVQVQAATLTWTITLTRL